MKLVTWNVNGIRSVSRFGFLDWLRHENADVVCVQEIKAQPEQLDEALRHPLKYHSYWHPAQKPGYSGVALYCKKEPLRLRTGIGIPEIDREGRVIIAEYPHFTLINTYFPNSQRDHARLGFKLQFCAEIHELCDREKKKGKNIVMCGDYNIAHQEIDLRNPKSNVRNAGFLPEERQWLTQFFSHGYFDTFRHFISDPGHYTWWSHRPGVRERNVGWRLDYFLANEDFRDRLKTTAHRNEVMGSDHCPVMLHLKK